MSATAFTALTAAQAVPALADTPAPTTSSSPNPTGSPSPATTPAPTQTPGAPTATKAPGPKGATSHGAAGTSGSATAPRVVTTTTSTPTSSPSCDAFFGCGKAFVTLEPIASTYPSGQTPDVSDTEVDVNDVTDKETSDSCYTGDGSAFIFEGPAGETDPDSCTAGESSGPYDQYFTDGDQYSASVPAGGTPANTLPIGTGGTFTDDDCEAFDLTNVPLVALSRYATAHHTTVSALRAQLKAEQARAATPSGTTLNLESCGTDVEIPVVGAYQHIAVHVIDGKKASVKVAKATYELCAAAEKSDATPAVTTSPDSGACPSGTTDEGSATTGSNGVLVFPSVYLGGTYTIVPTNQPSGFEKGSSQTVSVPDVTEPYVTAKGEITAPTHTIDATLAPVPPTIGRPDIHLSVLAGSTGTVDVFEDVVPGSTPLTISSISHPQHGSVTDPPGDISYTADASYAGADAFTYTLTNAYGGTATGRVDVTVVAGSGAHGSLPFTGDPTSRVLGGGLAALVAGTAFTVVARRRRMEALPSTPVDWAD